MPDGGLICRGLFENNLQYRLSRKHKAWWYFPCLSPLEDDMGLVEHTDVYLLGGATFH